MSVLCESCERGICCGACPEDSYCDCGHSCIHEGVAVNTDDDSPRDGWYHKDCYDGED